jgi:antirestriction protein ArdC
VFWKQAQAEHRDPDSGEITARAVPVLRYYRVFNAAQADHLPARYSPEPGEHDPVAEPQAVLDGYLAAGPRLVHVPGDCANYHPATDTIRLPLTAQFRSSEQYYAAAFHEAGHSTGHPARLNRPGIAAFDHFGSGRYAREELVAEMTSAVLCARTGIDTPDTIANSAAYLASWLTALNDDHRLVITAAAQAQHASDLIHPPERQLTPETGRLETAPGEEHASPAGPAARTRDVSRQPDTQSPPGERRDRAGLPAVPAEPESPSRSSAAHPAHASTRTADWQAEAG